jgi:PAS domain S-box-containing protein
MTAGQPDRGIEAFPSGTTSKLKSFQQDFVNAVREADGFWLLFDHLRDVYFFAKDLDGRIILANEQLLGHYGLDATQVIGRTDFDFLPRSLAEKYRRDDLNVARSGEPLPHQIELFLDDEGIPDWYLTTKRPVFDGQGRVIGVMGIIQKFGAGQEHSLADGRLSRVIAYLREHFTEPVSERQVTREVGIGARQLQRLFKLKLKTSFRVLLIRMRVHRSCDLLRRSDRTLADIAAECGFYDQSSYSRQFKRHMGMTPRQYRNRW